MMLLFTACGSSGGGGAPDPVDDDDDTGSSGGIAQVSGDINQSGGRLEDANGAGIVIPANALDSTRTISITSYPDPFDIPSAMQASLLGTHGAVTFEPSGLQFLTPVTITIPTSTALTPGEQFLLYFWNEADSAWEQSEFLATVNGDGLSYSAQVTHFTTYTGGVSGGPGGYISLAFSEWDVDQARMYDVFDAFVQRFQTQHRSVETWLIREDCCWQVVGIYFLYDYKSTNCCDQPMKQTLGDIAGSEWMERYQCRSSGPNGAYQFIAVDVHWKTKAPKVEVTSPQNWEFDLDCFSGTDKFIRIDATATCGGQPLRNAMVDFGLSGVGQIDTTSTVTDSAGKASTTYTSYEKGKPVITTTVTTCSDEPGEKVQSGDIGLCVKASDYWTAAGVLEFSHPTDVVNFADIVTFYVDLIVDKETGEVTAIPGQGEHDIQVEAMDEQCSILDLTAPTFDVSVSDAVYSDGAVTFKLYPLNLPLSFILHCELSNGRVVDMPMPLYSNLEATNMNRHVFEFPLDYGEVATGTVVDPSGGDEPMSMGYSVNWTSKCTCDD